MQNPARTVRFPCPWGTGLGQKFGVLCLLFPPKCSWAFGRRETQLWLRKVFPEETLGLPTLRKSGENFDNFKYFRGGIFGGRSFMGTANI